MSMSAEICVVRDLLQNHRELFDVSNKDLERDRRVVTEQHKQQDMPAVDKVTNFAFSLLFPLLAERCRKSG